MFVGFVGLIFLTAFVASRLIRARTEGLSVRLQVFLALALIVGAFAFGLGVLVLDRIEARATRLAREAARDEASAIAAFIGSQADVGGASLKRMSEVLGDVFPGALPDKIATLSGPTFAAEVSKMRPAAVVVGARNQEIAARLQRMLHTPYFRPYTNQDIVGVEFGGSLKNIVAIASGIVEGLGLGQNSQAALITRGLSEITRLGAANGARPVTFQGLSGIGDLVLTCTSRQSRNYSVGVELAQGKSLKSIVSGMTSVAEGVTTSRTAIQLAERCNVEMPITRQMFEVLFENKPPSAAIDDLLKRPLKEEMSW